mgnify:CR=1 FL=1
MTYWTPRRGFKAGEPAYWMVDCAGVSCAHPVTSRFPFTVLLGQDLLMQIDEATARVLTRPFPRWFQVVEPGNEQQGVRQNGLLSAARIVGGQLTDNYDTTITALGNMLIGGYFREVDSLDDFKPKLPVAPPADPPPTPEQIPGFVLLDPDPAKGYRPPKAREWCWDKKINDLVWSPFQAVCDFLVTSRWILHLVEPKRRALRLGDYITFWHCNKVQGPWQIVLSGHGLILINPADGTRWNEPVDVADVRAISAKEEQAIAGGYEPATNVRILTGPALAEALAKVAENKT